MEARDFTKKVMAGTFFIGGLLLIFLFIFTLGKDKGFAKEKFQVITIYKNVGGLTEGAPTRLAGVTVGSVAEIGFLPKAIEGRRVKVILNIQERYKPQFISNKVNFAIRTEGVLGEKIVEIDILEDESPVDLTQPIVGEDPMDIAGLAEVFASAADSFTKTSEELSQIDMVELAVVMRDSSRALFVTSQGLNEIMAELQDIAQKSKRIFDRIEQKVIDGDLFKVF